MTEIEILEIIRDNNGTWLQGEKGEFLDSKILAHLARQGEIEHHDDTKYHYAFQRGGKKRYYITVGGLCALWEAHGCRGDRPTYPTSMRQFHWTLPDEIYNAPMVPRCVREDIDPQTGARTLKLVLREKARQEEQQRAAERLTARLALKEENRMAKQRLRDLKQANRGKRP